MNLLSAITTKDVLNQLMNIHGSDWNAIIRSEKDKLVIKGDLQGVINKTIDPRSHGFEESLVPEIIANAIGEYGHFVDINSSGEMSSSDKQVFEEFKDEALKDPTSTEALSWYYGLRNAANPESLDMLADALDYTEDASTSFTIARNISSILEGEGGYKPDPNLDFAYQKKYRPHLQEPYYKKRGRWKKSVRNSARKLQESYLNLKKNINDKDFLEKYKSIGNKVFKLTKVAKDSVPGDSKTKKINAKEVPIERKLASNDKNEEIERSPDQEKEYIESPSRKLPFYFLILGMILLSIMLLRKIKS